MCDEIISTIDTDFEMDYLFYSANTATDAEMVITDYEGGLPESCFPNPSSGYTTEK